MTKDDSIVKQGRQGYSALAPGGPVIGIPGQFLRNLAPGALKRARRGDSPIFEGEPGSEEIPSDVKVTVEPPKPPARLPEAESDELPASEPEELPTGGEVIDVEPVVKDAEPLKEE
jgi:hypothetical protein